MRKNVIVAQPRVTIQDFRTQVVAYALNCSSAHRLFNTNVHNRVEKGATYVLSVTQSHFLADCTESGAKTVWIGDTDYKLSSC